VKSPRRWRWWVGRDGAAVHDYSKSWICFLRTARSRLARKPPRIIAAIRRNGTS